MPLSPYEPPLRKLVKCLDETLVKDKEYTVNEVAELCGSDPRTVSTYVYKDLNEVNARMPPPKRVVQKEICPCYKGLIVDPPQTSNKNAEPLLRAIGTVAGTVAAVDGVRRLGRGDGLGAAELAGGAVIGLLSIFA